MRKFIKNKQFISKPHMLWLLFFLVCSVHFIGDCFGFAETEKFLLAGIIRPIFLDFHIHDCNCFKNSYTVPISLALLNWGAI